MSFLHQTLNLSERYVGIFELYVVESKFPLAATSIGKSAGSPLVKEINSKSPVHLKKKALLQFPGHNTIIFLFQNVCI